MTLSIRPSHARFPKVCLDYMTTGKKAAPKVWDTNLRLGEKTAFAETRTKKDRFRRQTPIAAIAIEACHAGSTNTVTEEGGGHHFVFPFSEGISCTGRQLKMIGASQ